jgi:2-keto-3-deoxy-6-phosphogluconate aldolase
MSRRCGEARAAGYHLIVGYHTRRVSALCEGRTVAVEAAARSLVPMAHVYRDVGPIPTGGIDGSNFARYLAAPGMLAVGGSWIASKDFIRAGSDDEIERLARAAQETRS